MDLSRELALSSSFQDNKLLLLAWKVRILTRVLRVNSNADLITALIRNFPLSIKWDIRYVEECTCVKGIFRS